MEITDSISYDVLGSEFAAECRNERGSFKRNFARFGRKDVEAVGGALLPDEAVSSSSLIDGHINPATRQDPPEAVQLDATGFSGGEFETASEPEASGDRCLRSTVSSSPKSKAASITLDCAAGTYQNYAGILADSWNGDSVYYRLDGSNWLAAEKIKPPSGFEWHGAAPNNSPTYQVNFIDGQHTLKLACGNDDVLIDELLVASDAFIVGSYGESANQ